MLTTKDFRDTATRFRQTSAGARRVEEELENRVKARTAREREALESAMRTYQAAVKRELAAPDNRAQVQQLEAYATDMQSTLEKCFNAFEKTVEAIQASGDTDAVKRDKINKTADFVMGQLFTEEERALFGGMLSQVLVVIPSQSEQQSLLHAPAHDGWTPVDSAGGPEPSEVRMLRPPGSYTW